MSKIYIAMVSLLGTYAFRPRASSIGSFDHLVGAGDDSRRQRRGQSALMPVNFTTLPHFSVSSAMSLPKSAGESASTSPPSSARRAFILGSARPALISVLSFSTISAGVAFGAPTPYQVLTS